MAITWTSQDACKLEITSLEKILKTDLVKGLNSNEISTRHILYGKNKLPEPKLKSIFDSIFDQFKDKMVIGLLIAAVVSFVLALTEPVTSFSSLVEPFVILAILLGNACIGVWQERKAEAAVASLQSLQPSFAIAVRDGNQTYCSVSDLTPGDIILLSDGDIVPADVRIVKLHTPSLKTEESNLTGEPEAVEKFPCNMDMDDIPLQLKSNILFSGTTVVAGSCRALVYFTGLNTEVGKIHSAVDKADEEIEQTPLQKKLDEFGNQLAHIIFWICVAVWTINIRNFSKYEKGWFRGCLYYLKIAVSLAVAAIPEGLPAVITTCLSLGTKRMAKHNAIVRRLMSVQTLGCTSVICTDKTGTLTTNNMVVHSICYHTEEKINRISLTTKEEVALARKTPGPIRSMITRIGTFCNVADALPDGTFKGAPTELALKQMVEQLGSGYKDIDDLWLDRTRQPDQVFGLGNELKKRCSVNAILEFTRERKSMSVIVKNSEEKNSQFAADVSDKNILYCKGAAEELLLRCSELMLSNGKIIPMTSELKELTLEKITSMASEGLRAVTLAYKQDLSDELKQYDCETMGIPQSILKYENFVNIETDLIFVGVAGIYDPPREECALAVLKCKQAGIRVIMITGDSPITAAAIAKKVNIGSSDSQVITGAQFDKYSLIEKKNLLCADNSISIFARTEPRHKQEIVSLLKDLGEITAMTGDGVNDTPALVKADIGIAMGKSGTDVARSVADIVLADDNFNTIVLAVEEGRSIYNNMKAFIRYLISSNTGEVACIFLAAVLGLPEVFLPVQLLWVNLVTDGLPATALSFNLPESTAMRSPPRKHNDQLISGPLLLKYLIIGSYVGIATVIVFIWTYIWDRSNGHTPISYSGLIKHTSCSNWSIDDLMSYFSTTELIAPGGVAVSSACEYFSVGNKRAGTISLTTLVAIEMLNGFNALSNSDSLLVVPPWKNMYLVAAVMISMLLHCFLLYNSWMQEAFSVVPISFLDWFISLFFSFPVILVDEYFKYRNRVALQYEILLEN